MIGAGNGAGGPIDERQPEGSPSLGDRSRRIQHDAEALAADVRDASDGMQRYLAAQVEQRPLRTLGVAAAAGFVLGGGLSARLTVFVLGAATRVATALVAREVGSRILQSGGASAQNKSS